MSDPTLPAPPDAPPPSAPEADPPGGPAAAPGGAGGGSGSDAGPSDESSLPERVHLRIVSVRGRATDDEADELCLDTAVGQLGMRAGHLPMLALVVPGLLSYTKGAERRHVALSGGFVEFRPREVIVLARTAECAADIDLDRAQATFRELSRQLQDMGLDDPRYGETDQHRRRAAARIRAVELTRAGL